MDWVKLASTYYNDPALMRAGEAAEVLFTRGLAYAGCHETDGIIPREVLPRLTPTRAPARARALVAEGLWSVVPQGWRIVAWDRHQVTGGELQKRREATRTRVARHRARSSAVSSGVTNASVTPTEVEEEVDAAAAATGAAAAAVSLPPSIDILRRKLQGITALQALRFDTLTAEQATELDELIHLHGDERLAEIALTTLRGNGPTFVTGFIGTWRALPPPGHRVHAVPEPPCLERGHSGTVRHCIQCAADAKAGDR
ncbi:MAG: hypothetical protein JWO46_755 [Nocardioidaceae bacterium]|nr:hypothetical protein [Nocardioidaceae bacterium]